MSQIQQLAGGEITPDVITSGTATTTGNTTAIISNGATPVNIAVPNNGAVSVRANIVGYDTTANLATGGELIGTARNVAGTVTVVNVDTTENDDPAIHDTSWTLVASGTNVQVQVKGTANAPGPDVINWKAILDFVSNP